MGAPPVVAYLVRLPFAEWQGRVWGFDILHRRGFETHVIEVGPLMTHDGRGDEASGESVGATVVRAADWERVEAAVAELAPRAVFIDFVVGTASDVDARSLRLYRLLGAHSARLYVTAIGDMPTASRGQVGQNAATLWKRRLAKAANLSQLGGWATRKAILLAQRVARPYPAPARLFAIEGSPDARAYAARLRLPAERIVACNSLDYDRYVEFVEAHEAGAVRRDPICVFIDQAVPMHPDFPELGYGEMDTSSYQRSMTRLFDRLEAATGLRVVVAAHPARPRDAGDGDFGGREVLYGDTIGLVARSACVLAHGSTAVSFAVLFDKPLALAMTAPMVESGFVLDIEAASIALGVRIIDADDETALADFDFDPATWPRGGFGDYRDRYIASPTRAGEQSWDIIADVALRDLAVEEGAA